MYSLHLSCHPGYRKTGGNSMWQQVLTNLFSIESLLALVVGVVGGMVIGALPGLNATMASPF